MHAVSGLAWQYSKKGIEESLTKLGRTYDEKYRGLMQNLQATLRKISDCEAQFFDEQDWYDRYGFIYYTFMADRYKRDSGN